MLFASTTLKDAEFDALSPEARLLEARKRLQEFAAGWLGVRAEDNCYLFSSTSSNGFAFSKSTNGDGRCHYVMSAPEADRLRAAFREVTRNGGEAPAVVGVGPSLIAQLYPGTANDFTRSELLRSDLTSVSSVSGGLYFGTVGNMRKLIARGVGVLDTVYATQFNVVPAPKSKLPLILGGVVASGVLALVLFKKKD